MKIIFKNSSISYPVFIGHQIFPQLSERLQRFISSRKIIFITTKTLEKLYWNTIQKQFDHSWKLKKITISDKEKDKNFKTVQNIIQKLIQLSADKNTTLIGLGGGIVGDLTGFVASIYMRGIPFVSIPTSLLAQVDSSIGGKCGINLPHGKNLVGSFYHPKMVFTDIAFLNTLPKKDFHSGLAEVIKYAIISGGSLWKMLKFEKEKILNKDPKILTSLIKKCVSVKKIHIEQDEKDNSKRQILNLGHTIGHALETHAHYNHFSHGEAVAQGLYKEQEFSFKKGLCTSKTLTHVQKILKQYQFSELFFSDSIFKEISHDKKREGKEISWILVKEIGNIERIRLPIHELAVF